MTKRIYLAENVYEAALNRIRWLYDEFDNIVVSVSGGKDSDIVLRLSIEVARERGRLPVRALFIDQEAEWQATIDHMRDLADDPDVSLDWLQVPMRLFNATSGTDEWLHCWDPEAEDRWIRPKQPDSIHENVYGTDRFIDLFSAYMRHEFPGALSTSITGVRAEESPSRLLGLTTYETYKGETWGSKVNAKHGVYSFHPIYDWSYRDVWKAIAEHGWPYNRLYDLMYQHGVPIRGMRVSNVHHETAIASLLLVQEFETDTWNRVSQRLSGVNSANQLREDYIQVKELPWMFADWFEYRDYLLEHLVTDEEHRESFRALFQQSERTFVGKALRKLPQLHVSMILVGDYHGTKLDSYTAGHLSDMKNRGRISGRITM